eukprot:TRINITY_DN3132_c0_g1_i1.p1 TRINITY_DN3132_c0_g1~~TRINITY_DN3132_c0_g1_i1.p1  ORF type:complete len:1307 (+),score=252.91 TRINITY_DN3132_c0_g1_i1:347-4267(+)
MAVTAPEINIGQVLLEARSRWLKPVEIVDILRNFSEYEFQLNQEPPVKPPSGSLYLFDRKVVRYFRKDGHNWRKKKDGKTVREAHEKLKAGNVDMLHCYYAHSEEDDRFQRRCYWMLEPAMENTVLVHYREVEKGTGRIVSSPRAGSPSSSLQGRQAGAKVGPIPNENTELVRGTSQDYRSSGDFSNLSPRQQVGGPQAEEEDSDGGPEDEREEWEAKDVGCQGTDSGRQGTCFSLGRNGGLPSSIVQQQENLFPVDPLASSNLFPSGSGAFPLSTAPFPPSLSWAPLPGTREDSLSGSFLNVNNGLSGAAPAALPEGFNSIQRQILSPQKAAPVALAGLDWRRMPSGEADAAFAVSANSFLGLPGGQSIDGHQRANLQGAVSDLPWNGLLPEGSAVNVLGPAKPAWPDIIATASPLLASPRIPSNLPQQSWTESGSLSALTGQANIGRDAAMATDQSEATRVLYGMPTDMEQGRASSNPVLEQRGGLALPPRSPAVLRQPGLMDQMDLDIRNSKGRVFTSIFGEAAMDQSSNLFNPGSIAPVPDSVTGIRPKEEDVGPFSRQLSAHQILEDMRSDSFGARGAGANRSVGGGGGGGGGELDKLDSFGQWIQDMYNNDMQAQVQDGTMMMPQRPVPMVSRRAGWERPPMEPAARILFDIRDFCPSVCDPAGGTKILVVGEPDTGPGQRWACLFDNVEVEAEVVLPGVLRCTAPPHVPGKVSFAVTADDGQACSTIHHMEYLEVAKGTASSQKNEKGKAGVSGVPPQGDANLQVRLVRLLIQSDDDAGADMKNFDGPRALQQGVDEWGWLEQVVNGSAPPGFVQDHLLVMLMKRQMEAWVRQRDPQGRLSELDDGGLSALHMVAALDYSWAVSLLVGSGVNVDLLDGKGRTPLHWAAACGREETVAALIASGAAPSILATQQGGHPGGATPADLAAGSGHAGIAAYLANVSLDRSLSTMSLGDQGKRLEGNASVLASAARAGEEAVAQVATAGIVSSNMFARGDAEMEASLRALRQAAQAANLIQSFSKPVSAQQLQQQQEAAGGDVQMNVTGGTLLTNHHPANSNGTTQSALSSREEQALKAALKSQRVVAHPMVTNSSPFHVAALSIQKKFRGWKGRKDYLKTRHRIVTLQALVRGHLTRRSLRRLRWSVGIVEKAILRWRRKRKGLRFLDHLPHRGIIAEVERPVVEDNEKWPPPPALLSHIGTETWRNMGGTNAGLDTAVHRVQAMVQSDVARAQYSRLMQAHQAHAELQGGGVEPGLRESPGAKQNVNLPSWMGTSLQQHSNLPSPQQPLAYESYQVPSMDMK